MEINHNMKLTVEMDGAIFWGSLWLGEKLIVETAGSKAGLELSVKKILYDFHGMEPDDVHFDIVFAG